MFTLLFPGQGSQQPGMGQYLYQKFDIAKKTFIEASEALELDMAKLCFEGSAEDLAMTANTQPAILCVSTATARVLTSQYGVSPTCAAGHSIGEYAALVAGGVLDFADAMRAVRVRGMAMQSAVPLGQGGMVAVMGLEPDQVITLCEYVEANSGHKPLSPANFNSPGQIVISGSQKAIDWMKDHAKAEIIWPEKTPRIKLIPLQVSAPFHCSMMKPAEDKMREILSSLKFNDSNFPILQNYTAQMHQNANELRENLIRQVSAPVLWMQSMQTLLQSKNTMCIESGAGKVLQGLLKKIDSEKLRVFNTNSLEDLEMLAAFIKASN